MAFASDAGGTLVAEGIETAAEAEAVAALGVRYGQGYFYAKPDVAAAWSERGTFPVEVG